LFSFSEQTSYNVADCAKPAFALQASFPLQFAFEFALELSLEFRQGF
jgi:hypothetical protein